MIPRSLKYDHVVFDLDGTLVDSRADLAAAVNQVRQRLGLPPLTTETVTRYVGEGARKLVERALGAEHAYQVDRGLALFWEIYSAHLLAHARLFPGVMDLLSTLSAWGATLSVLSNKPMAMSGAILEGLAVLALFAAVLGGDSPQARKPDPAGVEYLRSLANTSRERLLLVGDSLIDVQTARAAGVPFCGVTWGFAAGDLRAAHLSPLVSRPAELLAVVSGGSCGA